MIKRLAATAALGLLGGALALAGPAQADHSTPDVTAVVAEDGCTVNIGATGELHVTNETLTAGLAVEVDGALHAVHRGGLTADGGNPQSFSVDVTVGPFDEATTVRWLLFGGPETNDDRPAQTDRVAVDALLNSDSGDGYDVVWSDPIYLVACPEPTPSPSEPPKETEPPQDGDDGDDGDDGGKGGELAKTGLSTGVMAGGAAALVAVGGGLYWLTRRRGATFTA